MKTTNEKIQSAKEILKNYGVTGKFRGAIISETNSNVVEFYLMGSDGIYCTVNIRSKAIKGI